MVDISAVGQHAGTVYMDTCTGTTVSGPAAAENAPEAPPSNRGEPRSTAPATKRTGAPMRLRPAGSRRIRVLRKATKEQTH